MAKKKNLKSKKPKKGDVVGGSVKNRSKNDERILKNILIFAGVVIVAGFLGVFLMGGNRTVSFEYKGVNFTKVQFCDAKPCLTTYNTKLPVIYQGERAEYNFFFRTDPREIEALVPFEGEFNLGSTLDLGITYGLSCEGYSSVALDNFGSIFRTAGVTLETSGSGTCGSENGKMYVTIQEGDKTWIEQTGDSCYEINIKGCDILAGTERFTLEALSEINKQL